LKRLVGRFLEQASFDTGEAANLRMPSAPHKLQLHLTNRCNLKCISCGRWASQAKVEEELSHKEWLRLVREAADIGVQKINLEGGGEPLVRKETALAIVKLIKGCYPHIEGSMITNATLVDENFVRSCVELAWDNLTFSIDAPTAELQDKLRGAEGTFSKNLEAIELLNKFKSDLNRNKPALWFSTVLNNQNYDSLLDLIHFAGENNVDGIILQSLNTNYAGARQLMLAGSDWQWLFETLPALDDAAAEEGLDLKYDSDYIKKRAKGIEREKEVVERGICPEPWSNMLINARGKATCCCFAQDRGVPGIEESGLKQTWRDRWFSSVRERWLHKNPPEFCQECNMSHLRERDELRQVLENGGKN